MGTTGRDLIRRALGAGRTSLDEREAKLLLAMYGVPTPAGTVVHDAQRAASVVEALGRPTVLKALGPDIQHKSDLGLVELDVRDAASARAAYHRIIDRAAGRAEDGVLVEEFVPHQRELLVGMRRDPQFGPVVAFGLGGIFTEAVADVAFALAPLDDADGRALVAGLRAQPLLGRLRGLPRVDIDQLLGVLKAVAQMAEDHPEIAEIDVNPLLVAGSHLVAADALVILAAPSDGAALARGAPGDGASGRRHDLDAVFAPASVAVVGASDDIAKWGGSVLANLVGGGFEGAVYPINPRGGTIMGLRTYASLHELPGPPDLAIVALGGAAAVSVVEECGRRGVRAAIVIAAGFAEAGDEGAAQQTRLARAADEGGVTLVGPNCMGVLCTSAHLSAVGFVTLRPEPGPLSVISQSGNIGSQLLMTAERRGIGVEKYVSSGNQSTTDANDLLAYLAADERTGGIAMYLEGLEDGRRFYDLARATTPRKPIIVVRGGLSALGSKAASSHTGALAGSAEVFRAAARQAGVILAADPDEVLDTAALLAYQPLPAGGRVAVVTLGGGWGVLTADLLAEHGLELAELPREVIEAVDELLPLFWSRNNPIDLVATVSDGVPERIIELVAACDGVDSIITLALIGSPNSGRTGLTAGVEAGRAASGGRAGQDRGAVAVDAFPELNDRELSLLAHVAAVTERTGKPVVSVPLVPIRRCVFPGLGRQAAILLPSPTAAVTALTNATSYATHPLRRDVRGVGV
ncbi:MAG TPA: acetate--CoA ligase family protein [Thermoleophilia bacterium]|nr:acetate--CoA ligase family protein [Thermoleophilia bacterium]